jgi:hypothetical protein
MALAGDASLMRLCLERILPPRKGRAVPFPMPPIKTTGDIVAAQAGITDAVVAGQISADEAHQLAGVLELQRKAIEQQEIEVRLREIEKQVQAKEGRS